MFNTPSHPCHSCAALQGSSNYSRSLSDHQPVFEAHSLSIEQYMAQLCRLIAREGHNLALRRNYEQMLSLLRSVREQSHYDV